MIPVADARALVLARTALLPTETVSLAEARGRILREPVTAPEDLPPFDRSAVDGFAIGADDASRSFTVVGEARAGDAAPLPVKRGQAIWILTGARLPAPGLRVVMQENVAIDGNRIVVADRSGAHIRRQGEDARAGETLLQPGVRLEAAALALLASLGRTSVPVARRPRVLHLTMGDEIVPPGQTPGPGQIRNSNATLVAALLAEQGAELARHLHLPDDPQAVRRAAVEARGEGADLVLVSGGSGPGRHDHGPLFFEGFACPILFRQVDVRPGKPLLFGATASALVFGLPGNPLSHFVCFHLFVRAALRRMAGLAEEPFPTALLAEAMGKTDNRRETWWPARVAPNGGRVEAAPVAWQSSGDITRLAAANALIRIPAGTPSLAAGAALDFLPTQPFL